MWFVDRDEFVASCEAMAHTVDDVGLAVNAQVLAVVELIYQMIFQTFGYTVGCIA